MICPLPAPLGRSLTSKPQHREQLNGLMGSVQSWIPGSQWSGQGGYGAWGALPVPLSSAQPVQPYR